MKCGSGRANICVSVAVLLALLASVSPADEVDDVLRIKAQNRDRVQRFSGEFTVTTHQPASLRNPKALRMRYRMKMERVSGRGNGGNSWRVEAEVIEPQSMRLKIEGEQAWFMDQHGQWVELQMTPQIREQFLGMSERFLGADPAEQRRHFGIKVLRHNNPIFGPRTRTLVFIPRGRAKMFARMEEDVNDDGLPLETRIFDDQGRNTVHVKVRRHRKVNDVPVVEEMESTGQTLVGEVISETECRNIELEITGR